MRPHLMMRAITPLGSIATSGPAGATSANRSPTSCSRAPCSACARCRVTRRPGTRMTSASRSAAPRPRASPSRAPGPARASPAALELATPEFHPGRPGVVSIGSAAANGSSPGGNLRIRKILNVSLAVETGRAVLAMDADRLCPGRSRQLGRERRRQRRCEPELASGLFPPAGVHAAHDAAVRKRPCGPGAHHRRKPVA